MSPLAASTPARRRRPSNKLLQAASMFALPLTPQGRWSRRVAAPCTAAWARDAAAELDAALKPSQIAFLTGPSGSGKSTLLRALRHRLGRRAMSARTVDLRDPRPLIDLLGLPLDAALATLARAGLAETLLLARPPRQLSEGERARATLACLLARAQCGPAHRRGITLLIDEFASTLDRVTAASVARTLRRGLSARDGAGPRLVAATAHDDLLEALAPDLLVEVPLAAPPRMWTR